MNLATLRLSGLVLLLALAACGGGGEDAPPAAAPPPAAPPPAGLQPTLASIQAIVFTPSCAKAGCHNAASAQAGLILDPGASWANLVNVVSSQNMLLTRVIPMDPDASLLIQKLEGTAIVGGRMPADGPPFLQQATVDVIRQWILDGAMP
ncbi:MAG TPA: hypothetical protein VIA19_11055 [Burkholderiales bacterium]|jgi:hypothetical protein